MNTPFLLLWKLPLKYSLLQGKPRSDITGAVCYLSIHPPIYLSSVCLCMCVQECVRVHACIFIKDKRISNNSDPFPNSHVPVICIGSPYFCWPCIRGRKTQYTGAKLQQEYILRFIKAKGIGFCLHELSKRIVHL